MNKNTVNIAIFFSAVLAIIASYAEDQRWYWGLKPLTTILVISLPLIFTQNQWQKTSQYRTLIVVGLLFCLAGDVFLMNSHYFTYGLGSFLLAHLLFTFVFYKLSNSKTYPLPLLILAIISIAYFVILRPHLATLTLPVAVYFSCIVMMCWQSFRLYLSHGNTWSLGIATAATLFMISDSIIAANKFLTPFDASGVLVLSLYWLSITIIANGFSGCTYRKPKSQF